MEIQINNQLLSVKTYKGQRVVTLKDVDTVHSRPTGTARKRFNDNRKHFIEGVDYFVRNPYEAKTEFGITAPNGIILITESGYLMLAKSFTDELAWAVQRQLVDCYFRCKSGELSKRKKSELEQLTLETKEYHYYDKTYNGQPVLTSADICHLTGESRFVVNKRINRTIRGKEHFLLKEGELKAFKAENPSFPKMSTPLFIVNKSGFIKVMKMLGSKDELPQCFIAPADETYSPRKSMVSLMGYLSREIAMIDEYRRRMLTDMTIPEAEENRKRLVSSIRGLKQYCFDVETIRLD